MANKYVIVSERPVKQVDTPDGGMDFLIWNFEKAEFESDLVRGYDYIHEYVPGTNGSERDHDTRVVSEAEFNEHVEKLRQKKLKERKAGERE